MERSDLARVGLSRRLLLAGTAGGLGAWAVGCAQIPPASTTPPPTAPPVAPSPPARPSVPSPPAAPTRAELVARHAGRRPTQWGWQVTGVVNRLGDPHSPHPDAGGVALTFDACGGGHAGSGYDEALIETLRRRHVPATLYLNARWIHDNPAVAAELADDPLFVLASHGVRHVPLSVNGRAAYGITGTADVGEAHDEITAGFDWFVTHTGAAPATMRPGTAHCDDVAAALALDLGAPIAGFSVNADDGATLGASAIVARLRAVAAGDIVLGHFNRPGGQTAEALATVLPRLLDAGVRFVTLGARP